MAAVRILELDVLVTRGGMTESVHEVHAAVVDASGLVANARDPQTVTYWRSCAKPFQVMPFVESGGFDEVRWGDDELALACASHGGEPEHVALAASMLADLDLEEGDLACGPHDPLSSRGARIVRESGERVTRLHNNCSGKHAAMLARAHTAGWDANGYWHRDHQVQRSCTRSVARWTCVPEAKLLFAVDGCGVVVYGLPLESMARSYAALAAAVQRQDEVPSRIMHAITTRPFLVGGTDRFDTVLLEETGGRVFAKIGAEGVHTVACLDRGIGAAVKATDGAQRAQYPAVLRLLQMLDVLPDPLPERLADFLVRPVRNTRNEIVGEVRPAA